MTHAAESGLGRGVGCQQHWHRQPRPPKGTQFTHTFSTLLLPPSPLPAPVPPSPSPSPLSHPFTCSCKPGNMQRQGWEVHVGAPAPEPPARTALRPSAASQGGDQGWRLPCSCPQESGLKEEQPGKTPLTASSFPCKLAPAFPRPPSHPPRSVPPLCSSRWFSIIRTAPSMANAEPTVPAEKRRARPQLSRFLVGTWGGHSLCQGLSPVPQQAPGVQSGGYLLTSASQRLSTA